ncbi:DUF6331 family protein [Rhizobium leguminosarum]|uniref:DUF6331 family protein n=1 Tax=Rhizobium leguminosarum TaxID=384 RepID=UPI003D7C2494
MIDIQLPPTVAALCKSCETICDKECCGIGAFSFSPLTINRALSACIEFGCQGRDSNPASQLKSWKQPRIPEE